LRLGANFITVCIRESIKSIAAERAVLYQPIFWNGTVPFGFISGEILSRNCCSLNFADSGN
jgi:hypothetical protein